MLKAIIGTKLGMTRIYDENRRAVPVSVIQALPNVIVGLRKKDTDGYNAVQLGYGIAKEKNVSNPQLAYFKKNNLDIVRIIKEFQVEDLSQFSVGQKISVDVFQKGDFVNVSGTSRGRGFAGTVKRHNFGGGPTTHGQSDRLRAPGSIGSQGPQHVLKGTRMAGHYGAKTTTIENLQILDVDKENNLILVKGAIPGARGGIVWVLPTKRKHRVKMPEPKKEKGKK